MRNPAQGGELSVRKGLSYCWAMKFAEDDPASGYLIQGYAVGSIRIGGQDYREGLLITPQRLAPGWGPESAAELRAEHIDDLLTADPQVIVLGTGRHQVFPDITVYAAGLARGVGIEIMDTGAACRTYNILVGEGRRVAAGLLMIA